MPLPNFKSLCGKKQKRIVSRDAGNPQQHIAVNESGCIVSQYKIDGDVIRDDKRCDYLVWNEVSYESEKRKLDKRLAKQKAVPKEKSSRNC